MPVDERQPAVALTTTTTGSPDTTILTSQQSAQSSSSFTASTSSSDILPRWFPPLQGGSEDHCMPPEWSFESSYGLYGGGAMSVVPIRSITREKSELMGGESVLEGSWFKKKVEERSKVLPNAAIPSKKSTPVSNATSSESSPQETRPTVVVHEASESPIPVHSQMATRLPVISATPSEYSPVRSWPLRSSVRPHTSPSPGHANSAAESNDRSRRRPRASVLTPLATIPDSSVPPTRVPSPSPFAISSNDEISINRAHSSASASIPRAVCAGDGPKCKEERDVGVVIKKNLHTPHTLHKPRSRRPCTATGTTESQRIATAASRGGLNVISTRTIGNGRVLPMASNTISLTNSPYAPQGSGAGTGSVSRKETPIGMFRKKRNKERERGFVMKNKKRHHPWPKVEAPYPRDYENLTVDHDTWQNAFTNVLAGSVSFHSFATPPATVLDLGCGTGDWILDCAREWKTTTFVGLDLVPIQPDLARLGLVDVSSRIKWVIANFLERLPFQDNTFDFVHIRRVARGVPEDKWHNLFEEITRVLKEDGAFEMMEEDLFFPGSVKSMHREKDPAIVLEDGEMTASVTTAEPRTPYLSGDVGRQLAKDSNRHTVVKGMTSYSSLPHESRPRLSLDSWRTRQHIPLVSFASDEHGHESDQPEPKQQHEEELFHAPSFPIMNPRDHSVLQTAYNELHTARFVNLTPLSVLNSAIILYFRDVHTHECVELSFPSTEIPSKMEKSEPHTPESDASHTTSPPVLKLLPIGQALALDRLNPNKPHTSPIHFEFEPNHLHMHLAARVTEVLACAEEMWDFIEESKAAPTRWKTPLLSALAEVTREEWEDCLIRYAIDMEDKIAVGKLTQARFAWRAQTFPRTSERKAFDDAVTKWEAHCQCQKRLHSQSATTDSSVSLLSRKFRVYIGKK